jgi:hypothetical protein
MRDLDAARLPVVSADVTPSWSERTRHKFDISASASWTSPQAQQFRADAG